MSGPVFNLMPALWYVPGTYAEFNNSNANTASVLLPQQVLLIGQITTGLVATGRPTRVFSADQVGQLCGRGSQLHQMAKAFFAGNSAATPCWILPLADAVSSTKSTRTLSFTGPATAAGEVDVYVGGVRYAVGVASGASAATIAAAAVAAIQADGDRFVDAAVDGTHAYIVNLTARNAGIDAGNIDFSVSQNDGEALPGGVGLTVGALTAGTVNPDLATALGNLGSTWFTGIASAYSNSADVTELVDTLVNNWGPLVRRDGYAFVGVNGDLETVTALPANFNNQLLTLLDTADCLSPPWVVAAGAVAADAALPYPQQLRQNMPLPGIVARLDDSSRLDIFERQQLIAAGVATLKIDSAGVVRIERLATTYRTNAQGQPDNSYFDAETLHILANLRYSWDGRVGSKWPNANLGENGSVGPNVVTPFDLENEAVALYQDTWMPLGLVQGGAALQDFIKNVKGVINAADPNRADILIPPKTMKGLRVVAAEIAFS